MQRQWITLYLCRPHPKEVWTWFLSSFCSYSVNIYCSAVHRLVHSSCFFTLPPPYRCVLGNTTILAEFASEEEISRFFAQGQSSMTPSPGWQSMGSSHSRLVSLDSPHSISNRGDINHWNSPGASGSSSGDLHGTSLWGTPNYSTSLWGNPSGDSRGLSSPVGSFLPVDHLNGEPM